MIKISDKPTKKVEYYAGTATMVFPNVNNKDWDFMVLRTSNGSTTFGVEANLEQFRNHFDEYDAEKMYYCMSLLEETVKANMAKEQADWKPSDK